MSAVDDAKQLRTILDSLGIEYEVGDLAYGASDVENNKECITTWKVCGYRCIYDSIHKTFAAVCTSGNVSAKTAVLCSMALVDSKKFANVSSILQGDKA